jgi:hypothetical protein
VIFYTHIFDILSLRLERDACARARSYFENRYRVISLSLVLPKFQRCSAHSLGVSDGFC